MHDKLSEAVKLYDRLLTAQISNSSRQYADYARASYQVTGAPLPPQQTGEPQPRASQWAAPATPQWGGAPIHPYGQQQPPQHPQRQFSGGYSVSSASTPLPAQSAVPWHTQQSPTSVATPQQYYPSYAPPASDPSTASWASQSHPQHQEPYPPQTSSPVQQYAPNPITNSSYAYSNQPSAPSPYPTHTGPQPQQSYQAGNPQAPPNHPSHAYTPAPTAPSFQLPSFPSAPTTVPYPYAYAQASAEQPQQKEAMLISFE